MSSSEPRKPRGQYRPWSEDEIDRLCQFTEEEKVEVAEEARILLPAGFDTLLDAEVVDEP